MRRQKGLFFLSELSLPHPGQVTICIVASISANMVQFTIEMLELMSRNSRKTTQLLLDDCFGHGDKISLESYPYIILWPAVSALWYKSCAWCIAWQSKSYKNSQNKYVVVSMHLYVNCEHAPVCQYFSVLSSFNSILVILLAPSLFMKSLNKFYP